MSHSFCIRPALNGDLEAIVDTIRDVTRKNSLDRILVENVIFEALALALVGGAASARDLFQRARSVNYQLKEDTFRSYLHRLKERGEIESVLGRRGDWKRPQKITEPKV